MTNPENFKPVEATIGDHKVALHLGNVGLAFFRQESVKDFLEVTEDHDSPYWVFNNRELMLWMHGAPIIEGDQEIVDAMNDLNGPFTNVSGGWRPQASVEDAPPPFVTESFEKHLLRDLENGFMPEDWGNGISET